MRPLETVEGYAGLVAFLVAGLKKMAPLTDLGAREVAEVVVSMVSGRAGVLVVGGGVVSSKHGVDALALVDAVHAHIADDVAARESAQ